MVLREGNAISPRFVVQAEGFWEISPLGAHVELVAEDPFWRFSPGLEHGLAGERDFLGSLWVRLLPRRRRRSIGGRGGGAAVDVPVVVAVGLLPGGACLLEGEQERGGVEDPAGSLNMAAAAAGEEGEGPGEGGEEGRGGGIEAEHRRRKGPRQMMHEVYGGGLSAAPPRVVHWRFMPPPPSAAAIRRRSSTGLTSPSPSSFIH